MSEVTQAIQGLTQYLFTENQRLDKVDKEKRVGLAAENIATKFRNLPSDASLQEIQALQFELVADAAALGGLQENMPLIATAYQSVLNIRQQERTEQQNKVLSDIVGRKFGIETEGISSTQAIDLVQLEKNTERSFDARGPKGKNFNVVFDALGKETFRFEIDAIGFDEEFDQFKRKALFTAGLTLGGQKELAQFKARITSASGMKFLKNKKGSKGELLYEGQDGHLYTLNKKQEFVRFAGGSNSVIDVKGLGAETKDVLATIEETRKIFGVGRFRELQALFLTKKGRKLLKGITGVTLISEFDKEGREVLKRGLQEKVETFFSQPQEAINKKLAEIREEGEIVEGDLELDALNAFILSFANQQTIEKEQFDLLPTTEYDQITDVKTWNIGMNGLENILSNPDIADSIKSGVTDYIGRFAFIADGSTIGMTQFDLLTIEQKTKLIKMIANNSTVVK